MKTDKSKLKKQKQQLDIPVVSNSTVKNNVKNDLILELNESNIHVFDDAIKFSKENETILIYNRKNNELLVALYPIGDKLMNKYNLSKLEFTNITKNIIKF